MLILSEQAATQGSDFRVHTGKYLVRTKQLLSEVGHPTEKGAGSPMAKSKYQILDSMLR